MLIDADEEDEEDEENEGDDEDEGDDKNYLLTEVVYWPKLSID